MNFVLFLLLNVVLLLRPDDLFPEQFAGLRVYLVVILLCVLFSAPQILAQLSPGALADRPITVGVLGFYGASLLSLAVKGWLGVAVDWAGEFGKVVLYYLLFVAVVNTPSRFRMFIGFLVGVVLVLLTLTLFQYFEIIDIPALEILEQNDNYDPDTGERITFPRLRAHGSFNDPNDYCLILTAGIFCCLARWAIATNIFQRVLWLCPIGGFGYAIALTKSRGGLVGLMAGLFALFTARYGARKGILLAVLCLPALPLVAGGRQSGLGVSEDDTSGQRVQFWSEGFMILRENPFTGIGTNQFQDRIDHVAHNSFVHAYVELGLLGGSFFFGLFAFSLYFMKNLRREPQFGASDGDLVKMWPYAIAIVAAYAGGLFSLSRNYVIPTYLIIALASSYLCLTVPAPPPPLRVTKRLVKLFAIAGVGGLAGLYVITRILGVLGAE